jgi:hypothetical protein
VKAAPPYSMLRCRGCNDSKGIVSGPELNRDPTRQTHRLIDTIDPRDADLRSEGFLGGPPSLTQNVAPTLTPNCRGVPYITPPLARKGL